MTLFWFLLAGLFLLALLWFCIEQHLLLVRRQTISLRRLPPEWDGLRILQITDILTPKNCVAARWCMAARHTRSAAQRMIVFVCIIGYSFTHLTG